MTRVLRLAAGLFCLLCALVAVQPVSAQEATPAATAIAPSVVGASDGPPIMFTSDDAISIRLDTAGKPPKDASKVTIRNKTAKDLTAQICFVNKATGNACSGSGVAVGDRGGGKSVDLAPYGVTTVEFTIAPASGGSLSKTNGYLTVFPVESTDGSVGDITGEPSLVSISIHETTPGFWHRVSHLVRTPENLLRVAVGIAVIGLVVAIGTTAVPTALNNASYLPEIDGDAFSKEKGWATGATTVLGLLTAIVGTDLVSDDYLYLSKPAYVALPLLFALLIGLAPSMYAMAPRKQWCDKNGTCTFTTPDTSESPKYQSFVIGNPVTLLMAFFLSLFAIAGQFLVALVFLTEIRQRGDFSPGFTAILFVIAIIVGLIVSISALVGMHQATKDRKEAEEESNETAIAAISVAGQAISNGLMGLVGPSTRAAPASEQITSLQASTDQLQRSVDRLVTASMSTPRRRSRKFSGL